MRDKTVGSTACSAVAPSRKQTPSAGSSNIFKSLFCTSGVTFWKPSKTNSFRVPSTGRKTLSSSRRAALSAVSFSPSAGKNTQSEKLSSPMSRETRPPSSAPKYTAAHSRNRGRNSFSSGNSTSTAWERSFSAASARNRLYALVSRNNRFILSDRPAEIRSRRLRMRRFPERIRGEARAKAVRVFSAPAPWYRARDKNRDNFRR